MVGRRDVCLKINNFKQAWEKLARKTAIDALRQVIHHQQMLERKSKYSYEVFPRLNFKSEKDTQINK